MGNAPGLAALPKLVWNRPICMWCHLAAQLLHECEQDSGIFQGAAKYLKRMAVKFEITYRVVMSQVSTRTLHCIALAFVVHG